MKRTTYYLFASAIALTTALPAFAQVAEQPPAAPAEAEQSTPTRDVVVITANKREETVQDIAVAVTALTAEAKEQLGVISVTDLTNVTPGLSYTPGNERITLRGIGRLTNSFGADPGVANYNDGIYTPFAVMAGKDPTLIQRVEVLRGPQGTLYGRNAIGGAINTISKRPTDDFTVDFKLGLGSYDYRNVVAAVSGPITDSLRYRVAGQREQRNGVDFNYGTGHDEGWEIDDYYYEGQLEGEIGDRFSWWLKVADSGYDKAGPPGGRTATFSTAPILGTFAPSGGSGVGPGFAYTNPSVVGFTQTGNRRDNPFATNGEHAYNTNYASTAHLDKYDEAIFEAVYETDWFDIKYTGGYTFYDYKLYSDADGTPIQSVTYNAINGRSIAGPCALAGTSPLNGFPTSTLSSVGLGGCITSTTQNTIYPNVLNLYGEQRAMFSNEINLISTTDDPLQWILGLYGYQENNDQPSTQLRLRNEPGANGAYQTDDGVIHPGGKPLLLSRNASLQNSYGAYGRGDYTLNDQWKLSLGLRYSYDIKDVAEEGFANCFIICRAYASAIAGGSPTLNATGFQTDLVSTTPLVYAPTLEGITYDADGTARRRLKNQWSMVTGDAGVEYRPIDDTLLFFKYSKGYKAGAVNTGFAVDTSADAEKVNVYEGGWKQTWADWDLTTNLAAFYYQYSDMQAIVTRVLNQGVAGQERTVGELANIPEATSQGIELEANWSPVDALNIAFSYSLLDTEITDGGGVYINAARDTRCLSGVTRVACSTIPAGQPLVLADPDSRLELEGNELPQAPRNKVSLNVSYNIDFEDGSTLLPTISWYWRDKFYDSIFNDVNEISPAYDQTDARITWRSADKKFSLIGWVRNAFDQEQNTSVSANSFRTADNGRYQTYSYAPPRMVGFDFKIHLD